jgi:lysophospholipase L1-like esterase
VGQIVDSGRNRLSVPLRRWLGLGLLATSLLVALEIGLRALGLNSPILYQSSPAGYEVQPDQHLRVLGRAIDFNHEGLRGPEIARLPATGRARILFLGDSVTNGGESVDNAQTYPAIFQSLRRGTEALNASAGEWAIQNEEKWLVEHGVYGSRQMVLEVGENDLFQSFETADLLDREGNFPSHAPSLAIGWCLRHFLLAKFANFLTNPPRSGAQQAKPTAVNAQVMAAIDRIRVYALTRGARMTIVYIDDRKPDESPEYRDARDRLARWASQHDVPLIRPGLAARADAGQLYRDDLHPSAAGNRAIAQALAASLEP